IGLRVYPWMPIVTSAWVGWAVGTGVAARVKLRIPAVANARPIRTIAPAIMGADPVRRADPRDRKAQRYQVIHDEAEDEDGEKNERRSRDHARGSGILQLWSG